MRPFLTGLVLLLAGYGPAVTEVPPQGWCGDDCVPILLAGLEWVSEAQSFPPGDIVLDTERTGIVLVDSGDSVRMVDRESVVRLATLAGVQQGTRTENIRCPESGRGCELLGGKVLVHIQPPVPSPEPEGQVHLLVFLDGPIHPGRWGHEAYLLTLENEKGKWQVSEAELIERS